MLDKGGEITAEQALFNNVFEAPNFLLITLGEITAEQALFNNVFEAPNLLLITLYTYVSEMQLPGNSIWLRVLARVLPWLAIDDLHHIM